MVVGAFQEPCVEPGQKTGFSVNFNDLDHLCIDMPWMQENSNKRCKVNEHVRKKDSGADVVLKVVYLADV